MEFTLDGAYLNDEYLNPYSFIWPTNEYLDGVHTLAARLHKGTTYGDWVTLTSECKANGGCAEKGLQYTWLEDQLATHTESCVLAVWHRPVVSMDVKRSGGKSMLPTWSALAGHGGDLVLNADTRDMEEVRPMSSSLAVGQPDSHMVELVSGAAAARWVTSNTSDSRVAWRLYRVPGAVFVHHVGDTLAWEFRSSTGEVLRSGSVGCTG